MVASTSPTIEINLTGVIMVMRATEPQVYASAYAGSGAPGLPSGPFEPLKHRTLELGLRSFALEQAGLTLGYVEQLYTFGDRGRHAGEAIAAGVDLGAHIVSIGYLALTRIGANEQPKSHFHDLYRFFPWEDWRGGRPKIIDAEVLPRLADWATRGEAQAATAGLSRADRVAMLFGTEGQRFDEEKVLERYELLYEAGLVEEAARDGRHAAHDWSSRPELGRAMPFDHRRILATALGRIRAKLKYRPVIFELMPPAFTLTALQKNVEAISGHHLHKQNFRRLVESGGLVEPTGEQSITGGRPAALFRFRHDVLTERPAPGLRLGRG